MRRLLLATALAVFAGPLADGHAARNVELLHGDVRAVGHAAKGRAAVVLASGRRVLTLRRFRIDPGPSVRVWLVPRSAKGDGQIPEGPQGPRQAEGQQGQPAVHDPAQRRPAPLSQRDLLVRAVHADARASEPRAVIAMHVALKLLAPPLVVVTLAAGLWFWSGVVAPGYWSTIVLGALWFVACSMIFGRIGRARRICAGGSAGRFWPATSRPSSASTGRRCATRSSTRTSSRACRPARRRSRTSTAIRSRRRPSRPRPLLLFGPHPPGARTSSSSAVPVRPQSHSASGTARVVKLAAGGRRLTLSDGFEIDPGPQVRVYLATDASGATFEDIGALKVSKGSQQYAIPAGLDLARYDTVVFWRVPFSQSLASAALQAA